ncbi:hypothetical protein QBC38DRAFT_450051 [Podospora fimiseda]|uniref:Uncharacterized protein n=1 Tax=Podospora fimiseda TaxID=252190 RepID=A0AAN7H579_9PEZI|nr:hypothetical protein QBC38DRAFT_450051 [Podospora fimiseda]
MASYAPIQDQTSPPSYSQPSPAIALINFPTSSGKEPRLPSKASKSTNVLGSWRLELISALVAVACVPILVSVLLSYNNRPLTDWPLGSTVTINTFVALLSTISRTSFMFTLIQALLQQRWNWYKTPRPLGDFQVFDEVTRGPLGSFSMVITTRGRPITLLASLVIFTSLITSTLTQSTVTYPDRLVQPPNVNANSVYKIQDYTAEDEKGGIYRLRSFPVLQTLLNGLFTPPDRQVVVHTPICPTSECVRPAFDTLAGKYVSSLQMSAGLRSGLGQDGDRYSTNTLPFYDIRAYKSAIYSLFLIYEGYQVRAAEVLFHYCVETYNISTSQNILKTGKLSAFTEVHQPETTSPGESGNIPLGYLVESKTPGLHYRFGGEGTVNMVRWMLDLLRGPYFDGFDSTTARGDGAEVVRNELMLAARKAVSKFDESQPDYTAKVISLTDELQWQVVKNVSQNIADGITKALLDPSTGANISAILGTSKKRETYIYIRWEWLSLLVAQVIFSIVVLFAVMGETRRLGIPVIKGSIMSAFFAIGSTERALVEREAQGLSVHEKIPLEGGKHKTNTPDESFVLWVIYTIETGNGF